jgi:hypothetical protein
MVLVQSHPLFADLIDFLASSPSAEEILAYSASEALQERLSSLLEGNRNERLSAEEQAELDEFLRLDHFVTMLKIRTRQKLLEHE